MPYGVRRSAVVHRFAINTPRVLANSDIPAAMFRTHVQKCIMSNTGITLQTSLWNIIGNAARI